MPLKYSLRTIVEECNYQKLGKLIQEKPAVMYESLSGRYGNLFPEVIEQDAKRCFDILLENKIDINKYTGTCHNYVYKSLNKSSSSE